MNIPHQAKLATPHKRNHQHMKDDPMTPDIKLRRLPRRSRTVMLLAKCPTIPITSPAGQRLIKTCKTVMNTEYVKARLDRSEAFCAAPPLRSDGSNRPRFMDKRVTTYSNSSYRKTSGYCHLYKFPRRQYSMKWQARAFTTLNAILLKQSNCKPLKIELKRLTTEDVLNYQLQSRLDRLKRMGQITLTTKPAIRTNVIDFIDLCSSDEESDDSGNNNRSSSTTLEMFNGNMLSDEVTLERVSKLSNSLKNTPTNSIQFVSTTFKKISSTKRSVDDIDAQYEESDDRLALTLNYFSDMSQEQDEQSFLHQNQENTCRYLNGGDEDPLSRVIPFTKRRRITDEAVVKNSISPMAMQQQLVSIDLT